jgi:hypothetical protein
MDQYKVIDTVSLAKQIFSIPTSICPITSWKNLRLFALVLMN